MAHTLAEKILLAHSDEADLAPGDFIMVRCDVVMANDVSGPVAFRAMEKMGAERVFDPEKVVMPTSCPPRTSAPRSFSSGSSGGRTR